MELNELPHHLRKIKNNRQEKFIGACMLFCDESNSQNFQDVWAIFENNFKNDGFFVEFGACDGIKGSNTLLLEQKYNWKGILAEPNPVWHNKLVERKAHVSRKCVYTKSGEEMEFCDTWNDPMLGTLKSYINYDEHSGTRQNNNKILVETISLYDLLEYYCAPRKIEFMSVDTEGSEHDILQAFFDHPNNSRYQIKCLSVEHNFTEQRELIHTLMVKNGYQRIYSNFSKWDDFFIKV